MNETIILCLIFAAPLTIPLMWFAHFLYAPWGSLRSIGRSVFYIEVKIMDRYLERT